MWLKQSARYQTYSSPSARKGSRFALANKRHQPARTSALNSCSNIQKHQKYVPKYQNYVPKYQNSVPKYQNCFTKVMYQKPKFDFFGE